ncbi:MAG: BMP family ABC transporter substrate-binding protein [bacterium]
MLRRYWFLGIIILVLVAGCGTNKRASQGFQVGMVTDIAGINDKSFNASGFAGMKRAGDELSFAPKVIETKAAADYVNNLQALANQKYTLVIAMGYPISDALKQVAPRYRQVKFAIVDGDALDYSNAVALKFREQEGSFLAGYLAGAVSKTGKIGFVGGMPGPLIKRFEVGYIAGAKTANPSIKVEVGYVGSWDDVGKAKDLALTQFGKGADIIFQASGKAGMGVIQAASEKGEGFFAIGCDQDQDGEAPGRVLTSMVKHTDNAVYDCIKRTQAKKFQSGILSYGVKEDGVGLSPMTYTKNKINPTILANLAQLTKLIADGTLVPPATDDGLTKFVPPVLSKTK